MQWLTELVNATNFTGQGIPHRKKREKEKRGNMFWSSDVECVVLCSQKRSRVVLTESRYEEAQTHKQGMHHRKKE